MIALRSWWKALGALALAAYAVLSLYPFLLMVSGGFKSRREVITNPWPWAERPTLETFRSVTETLNFGVYLQNSLLLVLGTCVLVAVIFPLAGYAFAVFEFPFKRLIFAIFVASLLVPSVTVLLPVVLLDYKLGLLGTPWAVILPMVNGMGPIAIILMRSVFSAVPRELREAALLDGCNELSIYLRVFLPLGRSGVITITVLTFVATWNEYVLPSVTNDDPSKYPLPVGLQNLLSTNVVQWNQIMAGATLIVTPLVIFFLIFQRYFINGLAGSVKG